MAKYNNARLTKRVEQLMQQLQSNVRSECLLAQRDKTSTTWITPRGLWGALVGSSNDEETTHLRAEVQRLQHHIETLIAEKQLLCAEHNEAHETYLNETRRLMAKVEECGQLVEIFTGKLKKKKEKYAQLQASLAESKRNCIQLAQQTFELKASHEKARTEWEGELARIQGETQSIKERIEAWKQVEALQVTPAAVLNLLEEKRAASAASKHAGGSERDEICALHILLMAKLKLGSQSSKEDGKEKENDANLSAAFSFDSVVNDNSRSLDEIKSEVAAIECPFKALCLALQQSAEQDKSKFEVLEKKEKLLNKMLSTQVKLTLMMASSLARAALFPSCSSRPSRQASEPEPRWRVEIMLDKPQAHLLT